MTTTTPNASCSLIATAKLLLLVAIGSSSGGSASHAAQRDAAAEGVRRPLLVTATYVADVLPSLGARTTARLSIDRRLADPTALIACSTHEVELASTAQLAWTVDGICGSVAENLAIERLSIELLAPAADGTLVCVAIGSIDELSSSQRECMARESRLDLGEVRLLRATVVAAGRFEPALSAAERANAVLQCRVVEPSLARGSASWPRLGRLARTTLRWEEEGRFELLGEQHSASMQLEWSLRRNARFHYVAFEAGERDLVLSDSRGAGLSVLLRSNEVRPHHRIWPHLVPMNAQKQRVYAGLSTDFILGHVPKLENKPETFGFDFVPPGTHELHLSWNSVDLGAFRDVIVPAGEVEMESIELEVERVVPMQRITLVGHDASGPYAYRLRSAAGADLVWSESRSASIELPAKLAGSSLEVWAATGHYGHLARVPNGEQVVLMLDPPVREIEVEFGTHEIDWFHDGEGGLLLLPTQQQVGLSAPELPWHPRSARWVPARAFRRGSTRVRVADAPAYIAMLYTLARAKHPQFDFPSSEEVQWWSQPMSVDFASAAPGQPPEIVIDPIRTPSAR